MADEQQNPQDLISIRNLTEGGARTPLREFTGKLDSYNPEQAFGSTRVNLNFADVDVKESTEPYNFPTAVIGIKLSNRKASGWGIFSDSLAEFLSEEEDIKDTIGLVYHMKMEVGHKFGKDRQTQEDMVGDVWHVIELEGHEKRVPATEGEAPADVAKDTPAEAKAKELLDGTTLADFNKAAYASPIIRKDVNFQKTITDKSFVKAMVNLKMFTVDKAGVYHKAV